MRFEHQLEMNDTSALYGSALSNLSEEDQKKYGEDFKSFFERAWFKDARSKVLNGYSLLAGFEPHTAQFSYNNWSPKEGDVVVAAYAKTGTSWMSELTRNILYCNDDEMLKKSKAMNFFYAYLEYGPESKYEVVNKLDIPRKVMGTHLPAPLINFDKIKKSGAKIIYIMRNPKDQAVSWYYFSRSQIFAKYPPYNEWYTDDKKAFFDGYLTGQHKLFAKEGEGYLEHIKEWYPHRNDSNIMFVTFEDLKENIQREIKNIANFLDINLSDEDVAKVTERTSLDSMRKAEQEKVDTFFKVLRKGSVGKWKDYLTVSQSEFVDEKVKQVLGDTDIKFVYELKED
ncbi:amine sulfotransferase-like [Clavelina lepadiformis]|uniref:amine sulfotransferase-like n=1 Tax=Clavelina lepadiformis TaxID=159417 RepID=UPI0040417EC1